MVRGFTGLCAGCFMSISSSFTKEETEVSRSCVCQPYSFAIAKSTLFSGFKSLLLLLFDTRGFEYM